jgi:elongator complex protein 2
LGFDLYIVKFMKVFNLLGHEDWIRDVHFTNEGDGQSLLLASCSQDTYIRLWRIKEDETTPTNDSELRVKGNYFTLDKIRYVATLEAVLSGHEDWVYSCQWSPTSLTLLTASMDKTMLLWEPDPVSGVWLERVRIGDVGGNTMGLYGAHFHPSGAVVLAHGYQGSFHLWGRANSNGDDGDSRELWKSLTAPSGHFESVQDCCWDPNDGRYLLSISNDQTCRLHGCWLNPSGNVM